jgi:hypothetical protein
LPGFSDDLGSGAQGGQGGAAGEFAETAASDTVGEAGGPAQIVVTFFRNNP